MKTSITSTIEKLPTLPKWLRLRYFAWLLGIGAFVGACIYLRFSPQALVEGIPNMVKFVRQLFPPDVSVLPSLLKPAMDTVLMAAVATVIAATLSLPLAVLAAGNTGMPRVLRMGSRFGVEVVRVVPDVVLALVFITAVGLGPFPGTLAMAIHSIGMLGKLYREAMEEIDPGPPEAVAAVGATRLQVVRFAVLPAVLPSLVGDTLYRFDINVRSSIIIGFVGAGGIGYRLIVAMRLFKYRELLMILMVVFAIIWLTEKGSDRLRKMIIAEPLLR